MDYCLYCKALGRNVDLFPYMQALQVVCTIYQFPVTSLLAQGRLLQFRTTSAYDTLTLYYLSHAVYATGASGIHVVTLLYLYYV